MIKYVEGDFFDYEADIRINTVNCVGVMGAGVALMFKNKFPDMFKDYHKACKENKVSPGTPHLWEEINLFSSLIIINFPTKIHWKNPSEYKYVEDGLVWLRKFLLDKENSTVTLPALGCGHGGLEWKKVKYLIEKYLGDLDTKILVFEPSSSTKKDNHIINKAKLEENNINILLPSDSLYPSKIKGTSAIEIYCKGNINLLERKKISFLMNLKPESKEINALISCIDELPKDEFAILLSLSKSYEIELVKELLYKEFQIIIVLSYGILNLKVRKDLELLWSYQNILVLSLVDPLQTWKSYENSNSFKFRLNISDIILINISNLKDINYYKDYIQKSRSNIFYLNYWKDDSGIFNDLGAKKIGIDPQTLKPNILSKIK